MARIRNPSPANARKRSYSSTSPARSASRQRNLDLDNDTPYLSSSFSRENSPGKNVHWGKGSRIISGPTVTDPKHQSQSPSRPTLRTYKVTYDLPMGSEDDEHGHGPGHGPSAQLNEELCLAEQSQAQRASKKPSTTKKATSGAGNVSTSPPSKSKTKDKTGSGSRAITSEDREDENICRQIEELKEQIWHFVTAFPARPKKARSDVLSQLLQPENEQLVRYVGCIAMGGRTGAEGWQELLTDDESRRAVVWGVIGRALKENVFDEIYFGAEPELAAKLKRMEREQRSQDGFYRQRARSAEIRKQAVSASSSADEAYFSKAVARVTLGIETLLLPLYTLGSAATESTRHFDGMRAELYRLVLSAAQTARVMRILPDVIYYFPPTLKDEEFEPPRMECLNLADMIRQSPYDRQEVNGRDRPILREGRDDQSQAIVRVVCFPGIQAYRQGGGALAKRILSSSKENDDDDDNAPPDVLAVRRQRSHGQLRNRYGEPYTGAEGIRTCIVAKSVVHLHWGTQRLLTKEAGTSVHLNAIRNSKMERYTDDAEGEVELHELFEERTRPVRGTPVLGSGGQRQRSPGLIETGLSYFLGSREEEAEEEEDADESELPIADFNSRYEKRMAEKRGLVGQPASPRGRKRSKR